MPVTLLLDVLGSVGAVPPAQMVSEVPKANVVVTFDCTVTLSEVAVAHWPGSGVNVYTAEF